MSSERDTADNVEPGHIPDVPPGTGDSALNDIQLPQVGTSYGAGNLDYDPDPNLNGRGALGKNIQSGGRADPNVIALQTYIAQELDAKWDGNEFGNTDELPRFGIDGVWRCETQGAFNKLLKQKGIDPCKESGGSVCGDGVPNCILDEATLDALKKADEKVEEEEEQAEQTVAEEEPAPPVPDQCYLINNIERIIRDSTPSGESQIYESSQGSRDTVKYKYLHKVDTSNPATMMNKLRMRPGALQFLNIRHWQLSQLVPTIRIYKQYPQGPGKEPREVEIKFNSFVDPVTDLQDMLNSQLQRGVGVGIEYLTYDWVGQFISTAKKQIVGKLAIYAHNFNELLKTRRGFDQNGVELEGGYRIIDILIPDGIKKDPNKSSVRAVVGWASTGGGGILEPELASAIGDTQISLDLGVNDYDIDIMDQDGGAVRIVANMYPRTEALTLTTQADIFADSEVRRKRKERRKAFQDLVRFNADKEVDPTKPDDKASKDSLTEEERNKLQSQYEEAIQQEMENSSQDILKKLLLNDSIYSLALPTSNTDGVPKVLPMRCDEESDVELLNNPEIRSINYFFLGDLLEVALRNVLEVGEKEDRELYFGNIRYITGPVTLTGVMGDLDAEDEETPSPPKSLQINIADIPISVELYTDFMSKKLRNSVEFGQSYPLYKFTTEVIKELVFEAMGPDCQSGLNRKDVNLETTILSADPAFGGVDPLEDKLINFAKDSAKKDKKASRKAKRSARKDGEVPESPKTNTSILNLDQFELDFDNPSNSSVVFDSLLKKSAGEQYHYFIIHSLQETPDLVYDSENTDDTRYERDFKNGVYHLTTGLDRGLLIGTTFSVGQRDSLLRSARFLQDRGTTADAPLANLFQAEIDMYGNNFFYPGMALYINPRGLGADLLGDPSDSNTPSISNILGLGGYHRVTGVKHRLDNNGYKVSVSAIYTGEGNDPRAFPNNTNTVGDEVLPSQDLKKLKENFANTLNEGGNNNG